MYPVSAEKLSNMNSATDKQYIYNLHLDAHLHLHQYLDVDVN